MTHDELIKAVKSAIYGAASDDEAARAAIRVIAPAVLDQAAKQFEKSQMSWRWGAAVAHDLRALKPRYEA